MKKILVISIVIVLITAGYAGAASNRFVAELEMNRASVGNPLYLYLNFYGARDVDQPEVPGVSGLRIKYIGPSTKITVVNGKMSQSVAHTYLVFPSKAGEYTIGPFFVDYKGETYKAEPVSLTVSSTPAPSGPSSTPGGSPIPVPGATEQRAPYYGDKVFLVMTVDRQRVYMNEMISLTLKLYVYQSGLKDIEYPAIPHEGFSAGKIEEPERSWEMYNGKRYDVLVFKQNIFGIKEGKYALGPAKINCTLMVRSQTARRRTGFGISVFDDDFFSSRFRYKTHPIELTSEAIPMTILPFPKEGRPRDFQGAVGNFSLDVKVKPKKVKVGDPVVVSMSIGGSGNLDTVTAPEFVPTENFKTYEPQVKKEGYRKVYEQVLMPKSDKVKEVPEVKFSFFNPDIGRYKTIRKGPFGIEVVKGSETGSAVKMVTMPGKEQVFYPDEELGEDIIHIKENIGRVSRKDGLLYESPFFWMGQLVPPFLFLVFFVQYRKKERMRTDKSYARFLRAPRRARKGLAKAKVFLGKDDITSFYDSIFKTLQDYLGGRFKLPRGSITIQDVEEKLIPAGCDEEMLNALRDIFSKCEMTRYASFVAGGGEAEEVLEKTRKVIVYLEKIRI